MPAPGLCSLLCRAAELVALGGVREEVRPEPRLGEFPTLAEHERDGFGLARRCEASRDAPDRQGSIVAGKRSTRQVYCELRLSGHDPDGSPAVEDEVLDRVDGPRTGSDDRAGGVLERVEPAAAGAAIRRLEIPGTLGAPRPLGPPLMWNR